MSYERMKRWMSPLLALAVATAVTLPTAMAGAEPNEEENAPLDLMTLSGVMNSPSEFFTTLTGASCSGGSGCGYCSASCGEGQTGSCTCAPNGETCWGKQVYKCKCDCTTPPPPPPPPPGPPSPCIDIKDIISINCQLY